MKVVEVIKQLLSLLFSGNQTPPCSRRIALPLSSAERQIGQQKNIAVLPPHLPPSKYMEMQEAYKQSRKVPGVKAPEVMLEEGKRLLLLDLDKTLIFYENGRGLFLRPYLLELLNSAREDYTIYIFTAANFAYADLLVKDLNLKSQNSIKGILCREHCTSIRVNTAKSLFIKDLRIIQSCHPKDMLVVDDTPWAYCLNPENVIPISPYEGNNEDKELLLLTALLKEAAKQSDIRKWIDKKYFQPK